MDYFYPPELNENFGKPLTPDCREVGSSAVFTRKFSQATVSVDCNTLSAKIVLADGRVLSSMNHSSKSSALLSDGGYGGLGYGGFATPRRTHSSLSEHLVL
eukprot:SAG25_NODE_1305_length_3350_cov_2.363580_1_plen_101_part_00